MKSFATILLVFLWVNIYGQAKRPEIMVIPDDNWCHQNGYIKQIDIMGETETQPNYEEALLKSTELNLVISKINSLFQDRGFRPKLLKEVITSLKHERAEVMALSSKTSGSSVGETLLEQISRTAKADIIIKINWKIEKSGFMRSVTYIMEGVDAYTHQSIASNEGAGSPSTNYDIAVLLEGAVLSKFDDFAARLQEHFDDLFANGRLVQMTIRVWESSPVDLESEFDGEELSALIEEWMHNNTVQGRFNTASASENVMRFSQVRIPMFDPANPQKAIDTRGFANQLRKHLNGPPYNLQCKLLTKGLGEATIIIGEK